jgi:hypothetical protein
MEEWWTDKKICKDGPRADLKYCPKGLKQIINRILRFQVLMAAGIKMTVCWDAASTSARLHFAMFQKAITYKQDTVYPGQGSNSGQSKYKAALLTTTRRRSITVFKWDSSRGNWLPVLTATRVFTKLFSHTTQLWQHSLYFVLTILYFCAKNI